MAIYAFAVPRQQRSLMLFVLCADVVLVRTLLSIVFENQAGVRGILLLDMHYWEFGLLRDLLHFFAVVTAAFPLFILLPLAFRRMHQLEFKHLEPNALTTKGYSPYGEPLIKEVADDFA